MRLFIDFESLQGLQFLLTRSPVLSLRLNLSCFPNLSYRTRKWNVAINHVLEPYLEIKANKDVDTVILILVHFYRNLVFPRTPRETL